MTTLFSVDFENGLLFDPGPSGKGFDIISVEGGTLAVSAGAAYSGTHGCSLTPYQNRRCGGAKIIHAPTSGKFRQAFWFDPNTVNIGTGNYLCIGRNYHYDLSQQIYTILLTYTGASFAIQCGLADNTLAAVTWTSDHNITDDWHLIETYWQQGSPGSFQLWIDGTDKETITATNNLTNSISGIITPGLGQLRDGNFSMSGSVYFDRWRANNDGSLIGA
jgi:hypothetical protein